jgi:hypothetical protein
MRPRSFGVGAAIAFALMVGTAPAAQGESITIETSAGPVTCTPDPERAPGPEALSATPFARGLRVAIRETGALRCATPTFGQVELTGAGLPWQLTLNEKRLTARLKGSRKPGILLQPVGLPFLSCLYQANKVLGTVTLGSPPSVSLTATRVQLDRAVSNGLCPALGPVSLEITLPPS